MREVFLGEIVKVKWGNLAVWMVEGWGDWRMVSMLKWMSSDIIRVLMYKGERALGH